jgi:hypothetical protein
MRREHDMTRGRKSGRNVTSRPSALGWNGYAIRTHLGEDNRDRGGMTRNRTFDLDPLISI